jgi:hypothetical protein
MKIDEQWPDITNVDEIRSKTFRWLAGELAGDARTMLDLGAGPCVFARHGRDAGFSVTAVDGRTVRLPTEDLMHGITFVESDVREFDVSGFDVVTNLGLLYHLELEDQIDLLTRCAYATVVLETQIHVPEIVPAVSRPWASKLVRAGQYEGVMFPEGSNPMASIGNATSFWHTERSLLTLIENCGYRSVTSIEPLFVSKYGARKFYVLEGNPQIDSSRMPPERKRRFSRWGR